MQTNQKLVFSLIKDDLINLKLLTGLNDLGINTDNYFLRLSDTVFELMGLNETALSDDLFEQYMQLTDKVRDINITDGKEAFNELALEIYTTLL